jgi:hypothetical protein
VVFDGRASAAYGGAALTYNWTFPDGTTATGPTAAWKVAGTGAQTVTLTVTAPDGRSGTTTKRFDAAPAPTGGGAGGSGGPVTGSGNVALKHRSLSFRGRFLRIALTCPATQPLGCAGRLRVTIRLSGRRTLTLGPVAFAIPKGSQAGFRVKIGKVGLRRLGRGRHSATVVVTQLQPQGGAKVVRLPLTVRR